MLATVNTHRRVTGLRTASERVCCVSQAGAAPVLEFFRFAQDTLYDYVLPAMSVCFS